MAYVQGFIVPVPTANKEAYRKLAADLAPVFKELGATRLVEAWGDDVPDGKLTDFKGAVKAKPDEVVVFSWLEFPSKAVCDAAHEKMMSDPPMKDMGPMPFDGQRMIFGGFTPMLDERTNIGNTGGKTGYIDGLVAPVPAAGSWFTASSSVFSHTCACSADMFRGSVAKISGEPMTAHMANSVRYSVSDWPGQRWPVTLSGQPWPPVICALGERGDS